MQDIANLNLNYDRPVQIAEGIYWVGFYDRESGLHCNPYLIIDGDEAVLLDGGSRPDFPTVMMKVLQTGIPPSAISALIYHHYDPDLCGSIPNLEDIINNKNLRIISDKENNIFIRHYYVTAPLLSLEAVNFKFIFKSGRELLFVKTPYAHSAGSFITLDTKSGVLFSSDLFGTYRVEWELFAKLTDTCKACTDYDNCPAKIKKDDCPLSGIIRFHKTIMTSGKSLRYALNRIRALSFSLVAPQHGSVITNSADVNFIIELLLATKGIGIDGISDE